jgi:hypothetical protein
MDSPFRVKLSIGLFAIACGLDTPAAAAAEPNASATNSATSSTVWVTNAPAVFRLIPSAGVQVVTPANSRPEFVHFYPSSLHHAIWTNFIAHTNGRSMAIWANRTHPPGWPANPPVIEWNKSSLMWGMRGLTALSPCWEDEGSSGQVPLTALTKRHAYTRGHGMGADGVGRNRRGKKAWFVTKENQLVEMRISREVIRTAPGSGRDYTIVLFDKDLPAGIEPMRVCSKTNYSLKYRPVNSAPNLLFKTEQSGSVSADVEAFYVNTWKGGDSGSPNLIPLPGELIFLSGRSTSEPSEQMQADMDDLSRKERLDPKKYQLQWIDLSNYPTY